MLKPLTLSAQTSMVSIADPAIDRESLNVEEFAKAVLTNPGSWREHVKAKPGESLTIFAIGVIPPDMMSRIADETGGNTDSHELRWRAFVSALRGIENWSEEVPTHKIDGVEYVDPRWIKKTFVRGLRNIALDVGLVAYLWNMMTEAEIKN